MRRRRGEKFLRPVHPNAGITVAVRRRLVALVDEMAASYKRWLEAQWRDKPPVMAADASPAAELERELKKLGVRWQRRFEGAAPKLAAYFATAASKRSDKVLRKILRDAHISVEFRMTKAMRDVMDATVAENVGLIKSIASEYHTQVQGLVMRSATAGRDLSYLADELLRRYDITKKRAALISRDQNNKMTAVFSRVRQQEAGIVEAIWMHSHGGKEPRRTHVANSGKRYKVAEGWYDPDPKVKRHIWPGELINCFPGGTVVGLETRPVVLWRAPFHGPMVHISIGADLLKGTLNHPVFTARGLVGLGQLDRSDYVVCMRRDGRQMIHDDEHHGEPTFEQLFEACAVAGVQGRRGRERCNFHGDVADGDVDEVVIVNDQLPAKWYASRRERGDDIVLAEADAVRGFQGLGGCDQISAALRPGFRGDGALLLDGRIGEAPDVGLAAVPHYAAARQDIAHIGRRVARSTEMGGDSCRPHSAFIEGHDLVAESIPIAPLVDREPDDGAELFAEFVRVAANGGRRIFEVGARSYEFRGVCDKSVVHFSGHVFTMQTEMGYYSVSGAFVQAKNCRCVSGAVVKGFS